MRKLLLTAAVGFASFGLFAAANATTFVFKGDGLNAIPTGNVAMDCGTVGTDFCSDDDSLGLSYSLGGIGVNATAFTSAGPTQLIQDITPKDSGLGALSEDNNVDDQTQLDSDEWIEFTFSQEVFLTNIEFNAGNDTNCSTSGSEGPCGDFDLWIDGVLSVANTGITAVDLLMTVFVGTVFTFVPTTTGAGFAIAKFDVTAVPLPGALTLMLSGLAGLAFASRRKRTV